MARMTIRMWCHDQEDWTGKDDVDIWVDRKARGHIEIGEGESKFCDRDFYGNPLFVYGGEQLQISEDSEALLDEHISADDIAGGFMERRDSHNGADYSFEIKFLPDTP